MYVLQTLLFFPAFILLRNGAPIMMTKLATSLTFFGAATHGGGKRCVCVLWLASIAWEVIL
jgi:hypothetical protein